MKDYRAIYPRMIHSFSCDYAGTDPNEYENHGCIFKFIEELLDEIDRLKNERLDNGF